MWTISFATIALAASAAAQSSIVLSGTNTAALTGGDYVTGTYRSYTGTLSLSEASDVTYISGEPTSVVSESTTEEARNQTITTNGTTIVTSSATATLLTASRNNSTSTLTATSTAARPTNTQPCNGFPEFCERRYSNITYIGAHNSPFDIEGNIAANQALGVTTQLNDGIRMLQFQVHKPNATSPLLLCHSSCDLLNAGLLTDYFIEVREWLDQNPYEVITILMGNSDVLTPQNFTAPVYDSGLIRYVYTPPTVPMNLTQWPTLSEMIITQHRVVMVLDYEADQAAIPWLLDEWANMWETPFSPTDREFPCIQDRPPNQPRDVSESRMFIVNHNLNVNVELGSFSLLIPATALINETNAISGYGSAGMQVDNCTTDWNRPPNIILVDFYNIGNFNGSIFQVAATANNVTYDRDSCCGTVKVKGAASIVKASSILVTAAVGVLGWLLM